MQPLENRLTQGADEQMRLRTIDPDATVIYETAQSVVSNLQYELGVRACRIVAQMLPQWGDCTLDRRRRPDFDDERPNAKASWSLNPDASPRSPNPDASGA